MIGSTSTLGMLLDFGMLGFQTVFLRGDDDDLFLLKVSIEVAFGPFGWMDGG